MDVGGAYSQVQGISVPPAMTTTFVNSAMSPISMTWDTLSINITPLVGDRPFSLPEQSQSHFYPTQNLTLPSTTPHHVTPKNPPPDHPPRHSSMTPCLPQSSNNSSMTTEPLLMTSWTRRLCADVFGTPFASQWASSISTSFFLRT